MSARRFGSLVVAWLCLVAGCGLLWDVSAQALTVHEFSGSFGSEGSGSGQFRFEDDSGIAVNDTTHDVYVVDRGNNRVEEFNSSGSTKLGEFNGAGAPTGTFSNPSEIAVDSSNNPLDPSENDVYVVDEGHNVIDKFSASGIYEGQLTGTPAGAFGSLLYGVAVDPNGVVWAYQLDGEIDSFDDAATNGYLSGQKTEFGGEIGLGVDTEDDLYISFGTNIGKLNSSGRILLNPLGGETEREEERINVRGFAVDASTDQTGGEVFVDRGGSTVTALSLNGALLEHFGSGHLADSSNVGVDESNGTVYVADSLTDQVSVFEAVVLPSINVGSVSEESPKSVTLNGTVTADGGPVTSCEFEYGTSTSYGQVAACEPALPSGSGPVAVSARLTGLVPEATYHYRLVATNANGGRPSPDEQFTTGPGLDSVSVSDVSATSATLQASIDPNGDDTHYYFQYGLSTTYSADAPLAPPGVDLGSSAGEQPVSLHVQGLEPGMDYHYRIVAVQDGEFFPSADRTFKTQPSASGFSMLDGRVWELVSPPNKKGALIEPIAGFGNDSIQAADDGDGIVYDTEGPAVGEDPASKSIISYVLSKRGTNGWSSVDIDVPRRSTGEGESALTLAGDIDGAEYPLFSPDLSLAAVEPTPSATPLLSSEATERTVYLRDNENGTYLPLVTPSDVPPGTKFGGEEKEAVATLSSFYMKYLTATPDLSHVLFESPFVLVKGAVQEFFRSCGYKCGSENLYEWNAGRLQLVNILPNGETAYRSASAGGSREPDVAGESNQLGLAARPISADGRWVVWTWGNAYPIGTSFEGLYVRDLASEKTFKVGGSDPLYQSMSTDGSRLFFIENGDLYEFDTATDTQTDLTADHGAGESNAAVQLNVTDVSEDGSYVYFIAKGVLAPGAASGEDNLYMLHEDDGAWSTAFIATLSPQDEKSWGEKITDVELGQGVALERISSRVSPDGRYLTFMSDRPLTDYDNRDANSGQPDEEVYLYDGLEHRLVCASCNPTGARPVGVLDAVAAKLLVDANESWAGDASYGTENHWLAGSLPGWDYHNNGHASYQPRYLSDSGRLFFDSPDALVPQATNGLEDVYEYEPVGVGGAADGCSADNATFSERADGCVDLISSGLSAGESAFYDASEGGDDAFFVTAARLTAADYDTSYDVYDAHVCTEAAPCASEPVSPPPCSSGDSCKAAPSPQPELFGPAPSATFSGTGNVVEETSKSVVKRKPKAKAKRRKYTKHKKRRTKGKKAMRSRTVIANGKGGK